MGKLRRLIRRALMKLLGLRSPSEETARIAGPMAIKEAERYLAYLRDIDEHLRENKGD